MGSSHSKDTFMGINFIAEVNIVYFISVSLVHISLADESKNIFRGKYSKLSKHSQELVLCDMAVICYIEILELGLQMNSSIKNCGSVLLDESLNQSLFFR